MVDALLEYYAENLRGRSMEYTYGYMDAVGVVRDLLTLWDRHPELHPRLLQLLRENVPAPEARPEPLGTNE